MTTEAEKAALWDALLASGRLRYIGCAGFAMDHEDGSRRLASTTPKARTGETLHFGMEFWSEYPSKSQDGESAFGQRLLTEYARALIERRKV